MKMDWVVGLLIAAVIYLWIKVRELEGDISELNSRFDESESNNIVDESE